MYVCTAYQQVYSISINASHVLYVHEAGQSETKQISWYFVLSM